LRLSKSNKVHHFPRVYAIQTEGRRKWQTGRNCVVESGSRRRQENVRERDELTKQDGQKKQDIFNQIMGALEVRVKGALEVRATIEGKS
jgi:hypothetical protein